MNVPQQKQLMKRDTFTRGFPQDFFREINICLIKNRSKRSCVLLLCLLRIFMRQTLYSLAVILRGKNKVRTNLL